MEAVDLSKVCRLCLKGEEVMRAIFDEEGLTTRIMACAQVRLCEGDGFPSNVCSSCVAQVERSYEFKLLVERSDLTLKAMFKVASEQNSDTESLEGEPWDMTKFTPEVIIKEEENNINGYVEIQPEPALLLPTYPIATAVSEQTKQSEGLNGAESQAKSRRCRGGDKLFKCRQCNKSYSFSSALSRHKAVHNTALRPHVCQICNKGFTQVDKLLRHQKTHSLDIFMTCDLCKRPFKSYADYQSHRMSGNCNLNLKKCEKCNLDVVEGQVHNCVEVITSEMQPEDLSPDARRSPIKGRPEFKCNVCFKNFATRGSLDVHSTIHTGVRPFVCSVCEKSFRHKVNLMEHFQRKHSQVRPYICDVCAARFVTKQELVRHYRKHIGD